MDFREQVEPHRAALRLHCYRLLGSLPDAEDAVQETLLAAWRGRDGFAGRSSLRTWLFTIATRRCLNAVRDGARRPRTVPEPPFTPPEPTGRFEAGWLTPYPDGPETTWVRREHVELAFVAGLQRLPPRQAAALVLCDVLAFTVAEAAAMLGTTPTAAKGALQRARAALPVTPSTAPPPGSPAERSLARRFAAALTARDLPALLALLTDDAWLAMPPAPHLYRGTAAVAGFLRASPTWDTGRRLRLDPLRANTQPGYAVWLDDAAAGHLVLTLRGAAVHGLTRFLPT